MMGDVHDLIDGKIRELAWIQFRESAKTSFSKGLLLYLICFQLDDYINVDSYAKENAERILYDVTWELQTNERIINDFGQIYTAERSKHQISQKRIGNFVTNPPEGGTGIRVEAHSTQEPVRGRLHGAKRPGLIVIDDFEVKKTIRSEVHTQNIREHIQEFKGGIDSVRGRILYLGNYLSEFANVQSIIEHSKVDPKLRVRIVPILDEGGNPTWPEKYVKTDSEANESGLVSIEGLKNMMWTPEGEDEDFMAEMMCQPIDYSNSRFKREWMAENRYYEEELEGKTLYNFMMLDNAPSTNEDTDWQGCTVISVDENDIWYVRYAKRLRLNTPQLIDELYRLHSIYDLKVVGVEQKAFEDLILPYIEKRGKELKQLMYAVELKDRGRRKEDRIEGRLQPRFATGRIKLKHYALDDTNELVRELARFPHGKNDDLMDSLQYGDEIAYAPQRQKPKEPRTMAEILSEDVKSAYEDFRNKRKGDDGDTI